MDNKGQWFDNRMSERRWRSLKYEGVYFHALKKGSGAKEGIGKWLAYNNVEQPHLTHSTVTPNKGNESKSHPM